MVRFGISVSTISSPLRLGYRLLNASTSHSSPPGSPVIAGSGFSLGLTLRKEAGFVGDPGGFAEPPVRSAVGLGARGGGPDGARKLIAGGAEADGAGEGMLGRPEGLA